MMPLPFTFDADLRMMPIRYAAAMVAHMLPPHVDMLPSLPLFASLMPPL